jgi:GAF domain-containing protein
MRLDFVRELGVALTVALENARLYAAAIQAELRAAKELEATTVLLGASRALAAWAEPDLALHSLADFLLSATGHARVTMFSWEEERQRMRVEAAAGDAALPLGMVVDLRDFAPGTRDALAKRKTAFVELHDLPPQDRTLALNWGFLDVLSVPLVFGDELVGLISIDNAGMKQPFLEREVRIAEGIASQAATAIANARLQRKQQRELANTRLLQDVAVAGAGGLKVSEVARRVLDELREHLDLAVALIYELDSGDKDTLRLAASIGYLDDMTNAIRRIPVSDDTNVGLVAGQRLALITHEDDRNAPATVERLGRLGLSDARWITLPVFQGKTLLGVMSLVFRGRRPFHPQEIDLFEVWQPRSEARYPAPSCSMPSAGPEFRRRCALPSSTRSTPSPCSAWSSSVLGNSLSASLRRSGGASAIRGRPYACSIRRRRHSRCSRTRSLASQPQ